MKIIAINENRMFQKMYSSGTNLISSILILYRRKNYKSYNRLGITVSKKIGNSVVRNKTKRRIKAAYIKSFSNIKTGFDIIIVARVKISNFNFKEICRSLDFLTKKGDLIK